MRELEEAVSELGGTPAGLAVGPEQRRDYGRREGVPWGALMSEWPSIITVQ